ncbi:hypothetical protein FA15DRAFT_670643 [Coprinopsis marcescibilis]|uniref:DUF7704 domain-containing protein n=1 Tax=Coprinopsis marcescibilis TaxID=230819 RepID=A0A5C3KRX1_COPMA|nr:hypothetical protein FA15DRAFT_670643 [Coprinopsis marcescibilis]
MQKPPSSALPDFYYFCFAAYEPFLTTIGLLGAFADPITTHNAQAPWPPNTEPFTVLPPPTLVTTLQLAHVCALVGIINAFVFTACRKHLKSNPALQEKIALSLLTPLLLGDVIHLYVTFWALGDGRWDFGQWSPMLWVTLILGLSLLFPRIAWHLGVGRYVDRRDAAHLHNSSHKGRPETPRNTMDT